MTVGGIRHGPDPVGQARSMDATRADQEAPARVGLGRARFTRDQVAERVGLEHEELVRWWRAMGFAEVPADEVAFSDADVEMGRRLWQLVRSGAVDDDAVLRMARLYGASFSRIGAAQAALLEEAAGVVDASALDEDDLMDLLRDAMLYVWRRHLNAALGAWDGEEVGAELAVGFADISRFSTVSRDLAPDELAELVDGFEVAAFDVVAGHGGRVVKLIGDEVMFVADALSTAVDIGLDLIDRMASAPVPVQLHCGVAVGPTVTVGGDVFGDTVNLASRLTGVARRGRVVVPRDTAGDLQERPDLELRRVRRVVDLKGFGRTRLVAVTRAEPPDPADADPPPTG